MQGIDLLKDAGRIRGEALQSVFELLEGICEGALVVDKDARVVWMSEKYAHKLGVRSAAEAVGHEVETIIPTSQMRAVVRTGMPILLDIMQFGAESFVVTRIPLKDKAGEVIGAIGLVIYDQLHSLKPLVSKFTRLQSALASAELKLSQERSAKYTLGSFVGNSAAAQEVKRLARRAAQIDATVLLLGETGTGKELLAQAIHASGPRAHKPFVGINVAAIPETLMEAEFFGAAPGAYSGMDRRGREGKFKLADGGTLFLDEIGDMPLPLQAKLLRVLQEHEFEPLGSNRMTKIDVRIIAATSIDLEKLVAEGRFRADLYYRLNVLSIPVPALRGRMEDLESLCQHLLDQIAQANGAPVREITPDAIALLRTRAWPGNIRELRNVLERVAMFSDDLRLTAASFQSALGGQGAESPASELALSYDAALSAFERRLISEALQHAGGKVAEAASALGMGRATLYKKLAVLGISTK
ncbi:MAG: sigma 54-interacting transcriptional regulator [Betaproteobacteria bacterium]|nr:sigma 54-interacting transcriptional regulator [Betaproteobacteria bacterium]